MAKRYSHSCVEQFIMNPLYHGYRNFRVEIFDNKNESGYDVDEVSINVPEELFEALYTAIDGFASDVPLCACGGDNAMKTLIEERKIDTNK